MLRRFSPSVEQSKKLLFTGNYLNPNRLRPFLRCVNNVNNVSYIPLRAVLRFIYRISINAISIYYISKRLMVFIVLLFTSLLTNCFSMTCDGIFVNNDCLPLFLLFTFFLFRLFKCFTSFIVPLFIQALTVSRSTCYA